MDCGFSIVDCNLLNDILVFLKVSIIKSVLRLIYNLLLIFIKKLLLNEMF